MIGTIEFNFETPERAVEVNKMLLEDAQPSLGGTIVYHGTHAADTFISYEIDDPRTAIDWLIAAEIIDPRVDIYILSGADL